MDEIEGVRLKKKKINALDDPLFYVPIIGPILHVTRTLFEEEEYEEEWEDEYEDEEEEDEE